MSGTLRYDLHSHSSASDGQLAPADLLARASRQQVDVLALTDHDTTAGLASAQIVAAKHGIRLINGVEISCTWARQTIHIVGLNINPASPDLQSLLNRMQNFRAWRGGEIGRKLEKNGIADARQKTKQLATGGLLTRSHYGHFLVDNGYADTMQAAFKKYLGRGQCGFVDGQWAALDEVIGAIQGAGGVAVIAHPKRYKMTNSKLNRLFAQFADLGGDGLEVVNAHSNANDVRHLSHCAENYQLSASVGSDFHFPSAWVELGKLATLPKSCTPIWAKF